MSALISPLYTQESRPVVSATRKDLDALRDIVSTHYTNEDNKPYFPNFSIPEKIGFGAMFGSGTYYVTYVLQRKELTTFEFWHVGRVQSRFNHYTLAQIYLEKDSSDVTQIKTRPVELRQTSDNEILRVLSLVIENSPYGHLTNKQR